MYVILTQLFLKISTGSSANYRDQTALPFKVLLLGRWNSKENFWAICLAKVSRDFLNHTLFQIWNKNNTEKLRKAEGD